MRPATTSWGCLLLLLPGVAWGGEGSFDAHAIKLNGAPDDVTGAATLRDPNFAKPGSAYATAALGFSDAPLVHVYEYLDGSWEATRQLDDVFALDLAGGFVVHERVRVELELPVVLSSRSDQGVAGPALGDARVTVPVAVLDDTVGLGVVPFVDLPVGAEARFLGSGKLAGGGLVSASYDLGRIVPVANVGVQFNPDADLLNITGAERLLLGVGGQLRVSDDLGAALEWRGQAALSGEEGLRQEVLGTVRHTAGPSVAFGTLAMGLSGAPGTPTWRLLAGMSFGTRAAPIEPEPEIVAPIPPPDPDGDGLVAPADACPDVAEVKNGWRDEDGCADQLARLSVAPTLDGKPLLGVSIKLSPADGTPRSWKVGDAPIEGMPGTAWTAVPEAECLRGDGAVTLVEGDNVVPLAVTRLEGTVVWNVTDAAGKPLENASIVWDPAGGACVPTDPIALGAGPVEQRVGIGDFTAFVTREGFAPQSLQVTIDEGAARPQAVALEKTKVDVQSEQIRILEKVHFKTNSAEILAESSTLLDEVATTIRLQASWKAIEVAGHTDADGDDAANLALSQARAEAVVAYLIAKGVKAEILTAKGYGETVPLQDNATAAGKAENRRVEFIIRSEK